MVNALATGVPALVFSCYSAGYKEVLEGSDYPTVGNVDEAFVLLDKMIQNVSYRQELVEMGLKISEEYEVGIVSGRFLKMIQDLVFGE